VVRSTRRWAIKRGDGCFATGAPWDVQWAASDEDCMVFDRARDARYLIDRVLRLPAATVVLLEPWQGPRAAG
jgi:hypothetical protein